MYGPGHAPLPAPHSQTDSGRVGLRIFFSLMSVMCCGFLSWGALLRLAILTRKQLDWVLFGADVALVATSFALIASDPTDDLSTPRGTFAMVMLLTSGVAGAAYYLYGDIRHYQRQPRPPGYPHATPPGGYGYPGSLPTVVPGVPNAPHTAATQHAMPGPVPGTPVPGPAVPATPPGASHQTPPPPQRPAPVRIEQVRAELDELSDYLRRKGPEQQDPEGGR